MEISALADVMRTIASEDEYNDTYGRIRIYQALLLKQPEGVRIPSERTVCRIMKEAGLSHRPKRRSNGITKVDREAHNPMTCCEGISTFLSGTQRSSHPLRPGLTVYQRDLPHDCCKVRHFPKHE